MLPERLGGGLLIFRKGRSGTPEAIAASLSRLTCIFLLRARWKFRSRVCRLVAGIPWSARARPVYRVCGRGSRRRRRPIMPDSASHQSSTLPRFPKIDTDPFVIPRPQPGGDGRPAERYEHLYVTASGDPSCLPWCHPGPNGGVLQWLNTRASGPGAPCVRTVVVGCGLGDDVIELANRGYDACGFDVSPTCIEWALCSLPRLRGAVPAGRCAQSPHASAGAVRSGRRGVHDPVGVAERAG